MAEKTAQSIYIDDGDVLAAMRRYGGGFVARLADAWNVADATNFERLKSAFPEYWKQYQEMATEDAKRHLRSGTRPAR